MAVTVDTTSDRLTRAATFLNPTIDWTQIVWFRWKSATTGTRVLRFAGPALNNYTGAYLRWGTITNATEDFRIRVHNGTTAYDMTSQTLVPGAWNWAAVVHDATADTLKFYLNNVLINTVGSVDLSAVSPFTIEALGDDGEGTRQSNIDIAYERSWQSTLTLAQLISESQREKAAITSAMLSSSPLDAPTRLTDRSGNARDWAASGTLAVAGGPFNAPGWAVRAASAVATGTTGLTIDKPTGTVDGDIMLMSLAHKGAGFATMPGGWTLIQQYLQGSTRGELYWKRASGEGANYSVTGLATIARGAIVTYTGGLAVGDIVSASSANGAAGGTSTGTTSITPTTPNTMLVIAVASGSEEVNGPTYTENDLNSMTGWYDDSGILRLTRRVYNTAAGISLSFHDGIKVVDEATGDFRVKNVLSSTMAGEHTTILAALIPAVTKVASGTQYALSLKYPEFVRGPIAGSWGTTRDAPIGYATKNYMWELSLQKSNAGHQQIPLFTRNSDSPADILLGRWITKPLAAQSISGTFNLMDRVAVERNDTTIDNPIPTAVYKVHIFVTVGDSTTVRHTLLDNYVDGTNWTGTATPTFQALTGAQSLTAGSIEEGDRIVVEIGCRVSVPAPYPTPDRPPDQWAQMKMAYGATDASGAPGPTTFISGVGLQDGTAASTATLAPFVTFSQELAELTPADVTTLNTDSPTATTISSLPYTNSVRTTQVPTGDRKLWWKWVATENARVFFHALGTYYGVDVEVYEDPTDFAQTADLVSSSSSQAITSQAYAAIDAQAGTTYYIMVRQFLSAANAPSSGGSLILSAFKKIAIAENDVILASGGYITRYTQEGVLADMSGDFSSSTLSGLAIDYTERPMDDLNGGVHTGHRLYVGVFSLDYVEILDIATLNLGQFEIDFLSDVLDADNQNLSSLAINESGMLAVGYFGNGFTSIADGQAAYLAASATLNSSDINFVDATHADNQAGSPYPPATVRAAAVDAAGTNYIEFRPDNFALTYASSSWYFPIGGQKIKQYDVVNGIQGPDFVTLPTGLGPNPGVRGMFPLPDGGVLATNGNQIVRLSAAGVILQTYTPVLSNRVFFMADVEIDATAEHFWALDGESMCLFKFNMETGEQLIAVESHLVEATATSIVLYRLNGITPPSPTLTRRWALHRFDIKMRSEEVA